VFEVVLVEAVEIEVVLEIAVVEMVVGDVLEVVIASRVVRVELVIM
jgi:hypothetical protein